jgi:integrase
VTEHRESPVRRVNPSGKVVWVARYTGRDGKRRSAGTFELRRDAQKAIDAAYDRPEPTDTLGDYFETWLQRHPRAARTNDTNDRRVRSVLDIKVEGIRLRDWVYRDLRRRHALTIVDHLLRVQGRAVSGANSIVRTLATMTEDAITDDIAETNPFRRVAARATDPRARKAKRQRPILSFAEMHAFAAAAGRHEPVIRTIADTGLRLGEVLGLRRQDFDGETFTVAQTAWNNEIIEGTKRDRLTGSDAGRTVPCPPGLRDVLRAMPTRIDSDLLFPSPRGFVWCARNFYRDAWWPTVRRTGMQVVPHDFRHSYVSQMRAAGIDDADLAAIAGHSVGTMLAIYTHPLQASFERVREVIG